MRRRQVRRRGLQEGLEQNVRRRQIEGREEGGVLGAVLLLLGQDGSGRWGAKVRD